MSIKVGTLQNNPFENKCIGNMLESMFGTIRYEEGIIVLPNSSIFYKSNSCVLFIKHLFKDKHTLENCFELDMFLTLVTSKCISTQPKTGYILLPILNKLCLKYIVTDTCINKLSEIDLATVQDINMLKHINKPSFSAKVI